jgi:hypothetical protein
MQRRPLHFGMDFPSTIRVQAKRRRSIVGNAAEEAGVVPQIALSAFRRAADEGNVTGSQFSARIMVTVALRSAQSDEVARRLFGDRAAAAPAPSRKQAADALQLWLDDQVALGAGGFALRAQAACAGLAAALGRGGLQVLSRNVCQLPARLALTTNCDTPLACLCGLAFQLQSLRAEDPENAHAAADPLFGLAAYAAQLPALKLKLAEELERAILAGFARMRPSPALGAARGADEWLRMLAPSMLKRMRKRRT